MCRTGNFCNLQMLLSSAAVWIITGLLGGSGRGTNTGIMTGQGELTGTSALEQTGETQVCLFVCTNTTR